MPYILDRPLYLNKAKDRVVEEGDPEAAFVLGGVGSTINDDDAKLYGLDKVKGAKAMRGEAEAGKEKAAAEPEQNKAKQPQANKEAK